MSRPIPHCRCALIVAVLLLFAALGRSQNAAANVDAALLRWDQLKSGDDAARIIGVNLLAPFDDARVTSILFDELERAGIKHAAVVILNAIAQKPRGNVVPKLRAVLFHEDADVFIRQACAVAIGKQGARGVDLLLDCVRGDAGSGNEVRDASFLGLAAAADERAWRGLAPMALKGSPAQQLHVLQLLDPVADVDSVTHVRERLLEDNNPELAALAWRQMVQHKQKGASDAADGLLERLLPTPPVGARVNLVVGLAASLQPDHFAAFLTLASSDEPLVQAALPPCVVSLAKNEAFVKWLASTGLVGDPAQRSLAFRILRAAPLASVMPLLTKARASLRPAKVETLDIALQLHGLLRSDPTWQADVLLLAQSPVAVIRTTGLSLQAELGCGTSTAIAQASLDSKSWELRAAAYHYLARFRELASIPLLIACTDKESGRLAEELNDTLFMHTGVRLWRRAEWDAWWQQHRATHTLPPEAAIRAQVRGASGPTVAYFGLPLTSRHVAFLIDVSGSMSAPIGTDRKHTRLDEAKRQLGNAIEKLSEEREFNVIAYESHIHPFWKKLRKAKGKDKAEALDRVAKLAISGGTNIFDALERAFMDLGTDTIYLLTDGQPTAGAITNVDELANEIRTWNYRRQVLIHCISIGEDSPLLKRISKESGGSYVFVR